MEELVIPVVDTDGVAQWAAASCEPLTCHIELCEEGKAHGRTDGTVAAHWDIPILHREHRMYFISIQ